MVKQKKIALPKGKSNFLLNLKPKICLNMIVKDEGRVYDIDFPTEPGKTEKRSLSIIERCLQNHVDLIDTFVIVDTGSTDNTIELIEKFSKDYGIKGKIERRPWVNFGYNRTEAIQIAKEYLSNLNKSTVNNAWYLMFADADNIIYRGNEFIFDGSLLTQDYYHCEMRCGNISYNYYWIVKILDQTSTKNERLGEWKWGRALHEYIYASNWTPAYGGIIPGVYIESRREGIRNMTQRKYFKDAMLLEKEIMKRNIIDTHDYYYCGQSWRDYASVMKTFYLSSLKDVSAFLSVNQLIDSEEDFKDVHAEEINKILYPIYQKAEYLFSSVGENCHFKIDEYNYCSLVEAAKMREARGLTDDVFERYLIKACQLRPHRREATTKLMEYYIKKGKFYVGYLLAKNNMEYKERNESVFFDRFSNYVEFFCMFARICFYLGFEAEGRMSVEKIMKAKNVSDSAKNYVTDVIRDLEKYKESAANNKKKIIEEVITFSNLELDMKIFDDILNDLSINTQEKFIFYLKKRLQENGVSKQIISAAVDEIDRKILSTARESLKPKLMRKRRCSI